MDKERGAPSTGVRRTPPPRRLMGPARHRLPIEQTDRDELVPRAESRISNQPR